MITIEELDTLVKKEFGKYPSTIKVWDKMKVSLTPHIEEIPTSGSVDFFGNETVDAFEEIVCSYADTYEDDLAYFCWKCGCGLSVYTDYWDGSETYTVSLPDTEEEYQKNLADADAWWKEVMEE